MNQTLVSGHGHHARLYDPPYRFLNCMCPLQRPVAFGCRECAILMCNNCFKLPLKISHWLHPEHPLSLQERSFRWYLCEGCKLASYYREDYGCLSCKFHLCIDCGISRTSRLQPRWEDKMILHYYDIHQVSKCWIIGEANNWCQCVICGLPVWGIVYACLRCENFIHESCIDIPQTIQHPFHPLHPLEHVYGRSYKYSEKTCNVCKLEFIGQGNEAIFECEDCELYLHLRCADSLLRTIKLECHTHSLVYCPPCFYTVSKRQWTKCHKCCLEVNNQAPHFLCAQCNVEFHFNCVSLPKSFNNKHHRHILTLKDPTTKEERDESYCDICEGSRNSTCHFYCCEECEFFGHITCVLSKEDSFPQFLRSLEVGKVNKEEEIKHADYSGDKPQVKFITHNHPLSLQNVSGQQCKICLVQISGQAYMCEKCDVNFWVHIECAKLPENFNHPLHPAHTLSLFMNYPMGNFTHYERVAFGMKHSGRFVCDICKDVSKGFNFFCHDCEFIIDVKCVFRYQIGCSHSSFYGKGRSKTLMHPIHEDSLTLANCPNNAFLQISCEVCLKELSTGLLYCCVRCDHYFHTTCLEWPSMVEQHSLHPQHVLHLKGISRNAIYGLRKLEEICVVCMDIVTVLGYKCSHGRCNTSLHLECGTSLSRLVKHKYHDHHLYYFHIRPYIGSLKYGTRLCSSCGRLSEVSYYRCLECKLNFHLECLQRPCIAKHKSHLHWLTFKDSIDFGGPYCDICEEPRDFHHPAYCCDECEVVACLNCIISEENVSHVTLEEI